MRQTTRVLASEPKSKGAMGRSCAALVLSGLLASVSALASAPALMPPSYSWIANTASASGAQALSGTWLARLGFLLFGLSVLMLVELRAVAGAAPVPVCAQPSVR